MMIRIRIIVLGRHDDDDDDDDEQSKENDECALFKQPIQQRWRKWVAVDFSRRAAKD
jgi:hypothetical protein